MRVSILVGPSPLSIEIIGLVGNAQWLIVLWGCWVDKNHEVK